MKVISAVVNNPEFIEFQYKTLKKFLLSPFEFIIFNDAKIFPDYTNDNDITIRDKIKMICNKLEIRCININNDHHIYFKGGSVRHAEVMNIILKYQIENPDEYLILDSDMFLIDYLDIKKYSKKYKVAIVLQQRLNKKINYIWPGLCYFNKNIENLELLKWDVIEHCDNGGGSHIWLKTQIKENEKIPTTEELRGNLLKTTNLSNIYFIRHLWSLTWNEEEYNDENKKELMRFIKEDERNKDGKYFSEIYDNCFFHYRGGCNWMGEGIEFHKRQTIKLRKVFESLILEKKRIEIISDEIIQEESDIFIGTPYYHNINSLITMKHPKVLNIYKIIEEINNPRIIYVYNENLDIFKEKLEENLIKNPFILISNSNKINIEENEIIRYIADNSKVIKWYCNNLMMEHSKMEIIPKGIKKENIEKMEEIIRELEEGKIIKNNDIYFYFNMEENSIKNRECFFKLKNYIPLINYKDENTYLRILATFKFSIYPEGDTKDSYRLWELFYLKVIPIVIDNPFIRKIEKKYKLPMVILKDWNDLIGMTITYNDYDNSNLDYIKLKNEIFLL